MVFPYEYYKGREGLEEEGGGGGSKGLGCGFRVQWIVWRCVAAMMGLFFFAAAFVQLNDPDPFLWLPAYTVPCVVSWAVAFGLTLKKYKQLPQAPASPTRSVTSSQTKNPSTGDSNDIQYVPSNSSDSDDPKEQATVVLVAKYGSANTKLNWLISIHILYCFALGIWTLAVHFHGIFFHGQGDEHGHSGTSIFDHTFKMDESTEEAKELLGLCLIIAWLALLRRNNYVMLGTVGITMGVSLTVIPIVAWICVELFEGPPTCA